MSYNTKIRTIINFYNAGDATTGFARIPVRTIDVEQTIPNVEIGHKFAFDHPQMRKCLNGTVFQIHHVVFLDLKDQPLTYIDVEVS